jgi:putative toxin-antitoxin system, toxin component
MMSFQHLLRQMHGYRVLPMANDEIARVAMKTAKLLGFTRPNRKKPDVVLEQLSRVVTLDVLPDHEWQEITLDLTKGHFSPLEMTIRIPERIYQAACLGEQDALEVILHELGHMVLMHQSFLHKSEAPPTQYEDPEWQADMFAEIILTGMGYDAKQMSLDFNEKRPDMP